MSSACSRGRRAITLLEIVLALAIAAIAMTLLTQLVGIGNRAAAVARDASRAQMVAESIMSEIMAGILPVESNSGSYEQDPAWSFEVVVGPGPSDTINAIQVTVTQSGEVTTPMTFSLTQWQAIPPEPEEEETTDDTGDAV